MSAILRQYGSAATIVFPLLDAATDDLLSGATLAAGDARIIKDEGASAATTNTIADEGDGIYSLALTATEMQAARIEIIIVDQTATKEWRDQVVIIETYGNASGQHAFDLDSATVTPAASSITSSVIAADAIGASQIAANAITSSELADGAITAAKLASDAITAAKIAADAIGASEIADGAIDAATFAADVNTYQAKVWLFKDTVGGTDHYVVGWFLNGEPVVSGITSPTIRVIKASDATDLVASTAMTEIDSEGLYKYDEGTNVTVDGSAYMIRVQATIASATRTWWQPVGRDA